MRRMMVLIPGKFQRRVLWVHSKSVQGHPKIIIKATARETVQERSRPEEEPLTIKGSGPLGLESNYEAGESGKEN